MTHEQITPDTSVNEVLAMQPAASRTLLELGIDTCCGGSLSLREAAADAGLEFERVVAELTREFGPGREAEHASRSGRT